MGVTLKDWEIRSQRRFGEFLQEYRSEFGVSRADLSDKIGVTRMRLARLESGDVDVDGNPDTLRKIADDLRLSDDWKLKMYRSYAYDTGTLTMEFSYNDEDTIDIYAHILIRGGLDWEQVKKIREVLGID